MVLTLCICILADRGSFVTLFWDDASPEFIIFDGLVHYCEKTPHPFVPQSLATEPPWQCGTDCAYFRHFLPKRCRLEDGWAPACDGCVIGRCWNCIHGSSVDRFRRSRRVSTGAEIGEGRGGRDIWWWGWLRRSCRCENVGFGYNPGRRSDTYIQSWDGANWYVKSVVFR